MLFSTGVRVSIQVLVVSCFCSIGRNMPAEVHSYFVEHVTQFMDLLKHNDPLLRGQSYYFIGCLVSGYLHHRPAMDLNVFDLLSGVLLTIMQDESAIAAKMACEGLALTVDRLLESFVYSQ